DLDHQTVTILGQRVADVAERGLLAVRGAEALHRRPRRNLRAVDREVLVRQQAAHFLVAQKFDQELVGNRSRFFVNTVATHTGSSTPEPKPAVQQVVAELLYQLRFRSDRVEACSSARSNRSGGIDIRPLSA